MLLQIQCFRLTLKGCDLQMGSGDEVALLFSQLQPPSAELVLRASLCVQACVVFCSR